MVHRLACVDIDQTMVGTPRQQLAARSALEQSGYLVAFVTSRTSETLISWKARAKSSQQVQARPKSTFYGDPASYQAFAGLIDAPYIAATTGIELLQRQSNGGYRYDAAWRKRLKQFGTTKQWFQYCRTFIPANGRLRIPADVAAPIYRVQVDFPSQRAWQQCVRHLPTEIAWIDDSNPAKHDYTIYLLPPGFNKQTVVDQILNLEPGITETLLIGDSQTDVAMGFFAGQHTAATFLIVGGARLPQLLPSRLKRSLKRTHQVGWYQFQDRTIIIGDEAFPGTHGPTTITQYLATV